MATPGILYGIGLGPGDPELITRKAYRLLQETRIIAFPQSSVDTDSYALSITRKIVDISAKQMQPLIFPMLKDKSILQEKWNTAADTILIHLEAGKNVAFVSEGDALFFSTFIHLMAAARLRNPSLKIEIVPGISSMFGAAAALGWGLVTGDQKLAVIPATANMDEMSAEIDRHDTIVFYKIAKVLSPMVELLQKKQLIEKSAIVSRVSAPDEQIYTDLKKLPEKIPYLSLLVVRK